MNARAQGLLLVGSIVCASAAFWAAHTAFGDLLRPLLKALGA